MVPVATILNSKDLLITHGLKALQGILDVLKVEVQDRGVLSDIDTFEDYLYWCEGGRND